MKHVSKFIVKILVGLALATAISCSESQNRYEPPDQLFSYEVPAGWTMQDSFMKYKICVPLYPASDFTANVNVVYESSNLDLQIYCAQTELLLASLLTEDPSVFEQEILSSSTRYQAMNVRLKDGSLPRMYTFSSPDMLTGATNSITQAIAPAKNGFVIFTFTCREERYEMYSPVFVELIKSASTSG